MACRVNRLVFEQIRGKAIEILVERVEAEAHPRSRLASTAARL